MITKRVRRLLGVAAMAPLLLMSCDSITDPFGDDLTGTYQLTIFAGRSVPFERTCSPGECANLPNGGIFEAIDGTLVLYDDGTFVETNRGTEWPTGGTRRNWTFSSTGTYTVSGDNITLSAPSQNGIGPRFIQASVEFDRINYIEDNESYEYRR